MRIVITTIVWTGVFAGGLAAQGEIYRDANLHFSLELPKGWQIMPAELLRTYNSIMSERLSQGSIQYNRGFVPMGAGFEGYPYVLVQYVRANLNRMSYEEIELEYERETRSAVEKIEGALADIGHDFSVNKTFLDRAKNQVILTSKVEVADVGTISGVSVGFFTSQGTVFLHCYDLQSRFQQRMPLFKSMFDSFKVDPGFEFNPAPNPYDLTMILRGALLVVLVFAGARIARRVAYNMIKPQLGSEEASPKA
jgi:hypothetical protein